MAAKDVTPWQVLGESRTPDGTAMALTRRGSEYMILADGKDLMSSRMKGSEEELATAACVRARTLESPRVLVGGLGMGFTLRAALDALPQAATVVVAELVHAVVEWNRGPLGPLAKHPLRDSRTVVELGDVMDVMKRQPSAGGFDAIMLDVDTGPSAFTQASNAGLYDNAGIALARAALRENGIVVYWSARDDRKFEHRLRYHAFDVEVVHVRARGKSGGGPRHTLFVGRT